MIYILILVAAVLVVLLTSLLKNAGWNPKHKVVLATVLSVVCGVLIALTGVDFTMLSTIAGDLPALVLSIYGSSNLIYKFILDGTDLNRKLEDVKVL